MNLALSNFAWDEKTQDKCFQILKQNNIKNLEIIFNKIKGRFVLDKKEILDYYKSIHNYGLNIYSSQSLFYNTPVHNISEIDVIIDTISKLIEYAKILGIHVLVFGSPLLRKKITGWETIIQTIFLKIDSLLENTNIILVIEPNSKIYNGEFFITLDEIVFFIKHNKFSNIKTMIDTHNLLYEGICPINMLYKYKEYIYHVHISEPELRTLSNIPFHNKFSEALHIIHYDKVITYEVNNRDSVFESIEIFSDIYT